MLKPTKKNQQLWVERHLNGGEYPDNRREYNKETIEKETLNGTHDHACWEAMVWFDKSNVSTLAEAWDKCPDGCWLLWCLWRMSLTDKQQKLLEDIEEHVLQYYEGGPVKATEVRNRILNPWILKNWKKGVFKQEVDSAS